MNAIEAYQQALEQGPNPALEPYIATDPQTSFQYSLLVLNAPFLQGETSIAQDNQTAFQYSLFVLKASFPAGESAIAQNPDTAYRYAVEVLNGRFLAGESTLQSSRLAQDYDAFVASLTP